MVAAAVLHLVKSKLLSRLKCYKTWFGTTVALVTTFPMERDAVQSSLTVLCVDDEPAVLQTLALVLQAHGFTVVTATNAAEALSLSATAKIDVALLDHSICDREQLCLRDLLHHRQPAIKAILHTGNPEVITCLGEVPVLAKPVHPEEIAKKIEDIIARSTGDSKPAA
jgi:CheY-like chemotaxis protein